MKSKDYQQKRDQRSELYESLKRLTIYVQFIANLNYLKESKGYRYDEDRFFDMNSDRWNGIIEKKVEFFNSKGRTEQLRYIADALEAYFQLLGARINNSAIIDSSKKEIEDFIKHIVKEQLQKSFDKNQSLSLQLGATVVLLEKKFDDSFNVDGISNFYKTQISEFQQAIKKILDPANDNQNHQELSLEKRIACLEDQMKQLLNIVQNLSGQADQNNISASTSSNYKLVVNQLDQSQHTSKLTNSDTLTQEKLNELCADAKASKKLSELSKEIEALQATNTQLALQRTTRNAVEQNKVSVTIRKNIDQINKYKKQLESNTINNRDNLPKNQNYINIIATICEKIATFEMYSKGLEVIRPAMNCEANNEGDNNYNSNYHNQSTSGDYNDDSLNNYKENWGFINLDLVGFESA